jgi:hypothetical protein
MSYSFKTSGWPERLWRTNNDADIARDNVPGSYPFSTFGQRVISPNVECVVRETGMPATLTVPDNIQLSVVSTSSSDTGTVVIKYLDGDLLAQEERLALSGTSSVTTTATDIRAINNIYSLDGPVAGDVSFTSGGVTYAIIPTGQLQFNTSLQRVPINKRLMIGSIYAGSASGSSAARVTVKLESSFINGDSFANDGFLHPLGAVAIQDNSTVMSGFGPFPIKGGEWVGFTALGDKTATVTAGLFGYMENL